MTISADFQGNREQRLESIEMGSMGQESPVMHLLPEGSYNREGLQHLTNSMQSAQHMYNLVISSDDENTLKESNKLKSSNNSFI